MNKIDEIKLLVNRYSNKDVIMCLNDTRINGNTNLGLENHYVYLKNHPSGTRVAGGVAILVPEDLVSNQVSGFEQMVETLCIDIKLRNGKNLRLATQYIHPGKKMTRDLFQKMTKGTRNSHVDYVVLMGDLNGKIGLLEGEHVCKGGEEILKLSNEFGFEIANEGDPTYISSSHNYTSAIDLTIMKLKGNPRYSWRTEHTIGSDHLPTILEIESARNESRRKRVNWANLREELNKKVYPEVGYEKESIERALAAATESIQSAVAAVSEWKRIDSKTGIKLSQDTNDLIWIRRKILNMRIRWEKLGRNTEELRRILNQCNKEMKRALKSERDKNENEGARQLLEEKDANKRWKLLKNFEEKNKEKEIRSGLERPDGTVTMSEHEMADLHAMRLEEAHAFPEDSKFSDDWKREVEEEVRVNSTKFEPVHDQNQLTSLAEEEKIGPEEIGEILRNKNNKSSAGHDSIDYKIIKHGGPKLMKFLASLFTVLVVTGYFPEAWKMAHIRMQPKPGKEKQKVKSYRPISLTTCLSKLYEATIKKRFEKKLSRIRPDNIYQAGYKPGRSGQEHTLRLTECVHAAMMKKQATLAVFLDVEGAFDKVWQDGLLYKLLKMGLPDFLLRTIASFLQNRRLKVKVGKTLSKEVLMKAGTPQGCVLSPNLFNAYVDDLRSIVGEEVFLAQYADDIAIWTTSICPRLAEEKIQRALNNIEKWTNKWRIKLAPEKTHFCLFTRCPTHRELRTNLFLSGTRIEGAKEVNFLGIKFDETLSWHTYREDLIKRVKFRTHILSKLAAKSRWSHTGRLVAFYKAVVVPVWLYGSLLFAHKAGNFWNSFKKSVGQAMTSIAGVPRKMNRETLLDSLSMPEIEVYLKTQASKRIKNILKNTPLYEELVEMQQVQTNTTRHYTSPIRERITEEQWEEIKEHREQQRTT